jgi:hypothetical protein
MKEGAALDIKTVVWIGLQIIRRHVRDPRRSAQFLVPDSSLLSNTYTPCTSSTATPNPKTPFFAPRTPPASDSSTLASRASAMRSPRYSLHAIRKPRGFPSATHYIAAVSMHTKVSHLSRVTTSNP